MHINQARSFEAAAVAAVLQEAAQWTAANGNALWSPSEVSHERILRDTEEGQFFLARDSDAVIGVMRFQLEDPYFWPEIENGTSAYIHKLAIRRPWAKKGGSTALLAFARERTENLGRQYLRLDCQADRLGPRSVYERFGFSLHSYVQKGALSFARYELHAISQPTY